MNALSEIIIDRIRKEGPISFRDFMEMALYYPELGYYTSTKEKIGMEGDYYTSSTLSPVFGALLGKQLEEMWQITGKEKFTVVEYGAGTGALCNAILNFIRSNDELYNKLDYCIIEKSASMREKARKNLQEKVKWVDSLEEISDVVGCVLSNEVVDNFSVHRVMMCDELMEIFVDHDNGFIETLRPADAELKNYLSELRIELPKGYKAEINLEATNWMKEIARNLKKGYVVTIDYGHPSSELYYDGQKNGTLMCYNRHERNQHPYRNIGEQDITSHVNFSALCLWGYKNGLEYCGFIDQASFLSSLGFRKYLKATEKPGQDYLNFKREMFLTNTLLTDMGTKFKVLIQQKALPKQRLLGLQV